MHFNSRGMIFLGVLLGRKEYAMLEGAGSLLSWFRQEVSKIIIVLSCSFVKLAVQWKSKSLYIYEININCLNFYLGWDLDSDTQDCESRVLLFFQDSSPIQVMNLISDSCVHDNNALFDIFWLTTNYGLT